MCKQNLYHENRELPSTLVNQHHMLVCKDVGRKLNFKEREGMRIIRFLANLYIRTHFRISRATQIRIYENLCDTILNSHLIAGKLWDELSMD